MKKIFFLTLPLFMSSSITCMDIHEAAYQGNLARVQELLASNPELVNSRDQWQKTPLHFAALCGHTDVVSLLLNHGAKVDAPDDGRNTPLHCATLNCKTEIALLLLENRADINARNQWQATPLRVVEYYDNYYDNREVKQLLKDWPYCYQYVIRKNNQLVAFCMSQHKRLGSRSSANVLPNEMFHHIAQFVIPRWPNNTIEQIHKIAEQERQQEHGARNIVRFFLGSGGVLAAAICAIITYRLFRR